MSRSVVAMLSAVACVLFPASQSGRAALIAPDVPLNGISQAELSARWWQWLFFYPDGANPTQDTTGAFSFLGADQTPTSHPGIFFLAGNLGPPSTRTVTVLQTDFLFFPLITTAQVIPLFGNTEAEIRDGAAAELGTVTNLFARLDGVDLPLPPPTSSLLDYRQLSPPGLFDLFIPPDNIFGAPPGTYPAVVDGFFLALGPLAPGNYLLEFGAEAAFSQSQTYLITVQAVPEPASLLLLGVGGVGLLRTRRLLGRSRA